MTALGYREALSATKPYIIAAVSVLVWLTLPSPIHAYSVLTHQAIVDSVWLDAIQPVLIQRFPEATEEQLKEAHAYTYGGCVIQDLGYYPFGSHFFSDLVHYVRSADFLQALLDESHDLIDRAKSIRGAWKLTLAPLPSGIDVAERLLVVHVMTAPRGLGSSQNQPGFTGLDYAFNGCVARSRRGALVG